MQLIKMILGTVCVTAAVVAFAEEDLEVVKETETMNYKYEEHIKTIEIDDEDDDHHEEHKRKHHREEDEDEDNDGENEVVDSL